MSSLLVLGRSQTLTNNRSASETDLSFNLRRRSVQSINNFSLRRILGVEPASQFLRSTLVKDVKKVASSSSIRVDSSSRTTKGVENIDGWRRTNRGDVIVPQPFSSRPRSHRDVIHTPAIIVLHPVDDSDTAVCTNSSSSSSSPPLSEQQQHHLNRDLASPQTKSAGKLPDTLSSSPPLTSILKPLFRRQLSIPHQMGNKVSAGLRHGGRQKENQSPQEEAASGKSSLAPALASPVSVQTSSSPPIVIPDRRSSITPQPTPNNSLGRVSSIRTIRPSDIICPPRSSTAPGTKPSPEHDLSLRPISPKGISPLAIPDPTAAAAAAAQSAISSHPHVARGPISFPRYLTLHISTPAPPLTLAHFACYQSHCRVSHSSNVHHPVPCMTCGAEGGEARWKCQWCCLRICPACMERLAKVEGRDLGQLLRKLEEEGRMFLAGSQEEWGDGKGRLWNDGCGTGAGDGGEDGGKGKGKEKEMGKGFRKDVVVRYEGREGLAGKSAGVVGRAVGGQGKENEIQMGRGRRGDGMERGKVRERGLGRGRGF